MCRGSTVPAYNERENKHMENITVIKEGIKTEEHAHRWAVSVDDLTDDGVFTLKRICKVCGRVENVIEQQEVASFDQLYQKFHGTEGR